MSLRARLLVVGVTGTALALAIGGVLLYRVLVFAVDRTLDSEARASAAQVAAMVDARRMPSPLPVTGVQIIQVVDDRGRVVAGSATADRLVPLLLPAELTRALAGEAVLVGGSRSGMSGPLRVRAVTAGPRDSPSSVIVALPVEDVLTGRTVLRASLLIAIPLLVLVLAAIAWRVIGRTLQPVEALRLGAERISGRDRQERLPVPEAADEIRALAVTLNGMLDRLAAARTRQQAFVADAAHELRSPLASMRTQLEVAAHLGEGGDLPADLLVDLARLSRLVEDLLLLARADADARGPTSPRLLDAAALAREVAAAYVDVRVPVDALPAELSEPALVKADSDELRRALANLVDNAVRHASSAVRLSVQRLLDGDTAQVVLAVVDDGPGIAPADRERVFDRFTRLDEARDRDAGGSGLGLAIVSELVARAGGTVSLEPAGAPGARGGLRAEIRLPAVKIDADEPSGFSSGRLNHSAAATAPP
ncbi:MAG TPA: ATP-binding protein [Propionibacteriaceae bacterium]|nr:ATP-binding protein [Propionibacteriaceae bacterium]